MSHVLGISELVKEVGDENIGVQPLDGAIVRAGYSGDSAGEITFAVESSYITGLATGASEKMGIVLWLPRGKVSEIIESRKEV